MKLFVPSMGSITQTRPRGFGQSNVIDWPVSLSSPTTPSSGNLRRSPATINRWLARSASVTASSLAATWVFTGMLTGWPV